MKRLYNECEAMNDKAYELFDAIGRYIGEIVGQSRFTDYSLRDIEQVIHNSVSATMAETLLRRAMEKRKTEQSK